jgi:hypothetical protein
MTCPLPASRLRAVFSAALLASLAGCPGGTGGECQLDADCGGSELCARDGMCAPASAVRAVTATWTINGVAASTQSCGAHPDLYIDFIGADSGDTIGFAPVPCRNGQFSVDKLPTRFRQAELGVEGGNYDVGTISATGSVMLDLRF